MKNNNKRWKLHEDAVIGRFHNNHHPNTVKNIANILGRSSHGVSNRISRLKKSGEYDELKEKYSNNQNQDFFKEENDKAIEGKVIEQSIFANLSNPIEIIKWKIDDINIYIQSFLDNDKIMLYVEDNILKAKRIKYEDI